MANNSVVFNEKPSAEEFLEEWTSLVKSRSGGGYLIVVDLKDKFQLVAGSL